MLLTTTRQIKSEGRTSAEILAILDGKLEITDSGEFVGVDTAMQQATVWACVRIIAEVIAQLPVTSQTRNANGTWSNVEHDSLRLLQQPNEWQTAHEFISHLQTWAELTGNAYYFKGRDGSGNIRRMLPLVADDVEPQQGNNFALTYRITQGRIIGEDFSTEQVFHLRNFGNDGYVGLSTISNLKNAIGLAIGTEKHGSRLFKHGAQPGLLMKVPSGTDEQITALQKKIKDEYAGAANAHKTMVVQGDIDVTKLAMTQTDAQFLETRHFSKQEIASAFGVPLFVLNDTQKSTTWGTGLEQQLRAFKTLSLQPRLTRLQQTLARELLGPKERFRTRYVFDTDAITLGDFKDRMEGYRAGIESGVMSPNEAREIEGRNPREGGQDFRKPLNIGIEGEDNESTDNAPPDEEAL